MQKSNVSFKCLPSLLTLARDSGGIWQSGKNTPGAILVERQLGRDWEKKMSCWRKKSYHHLAMSFVFFFFKYNIKRRENNTWIDFHWCDWCDLTGRCFLLNLPTHLHEHPIWNQESKVHRGKVTCSKADKQNLWCKTRTSPFSPSPNTTLPWHNRGYKEAPDVHPYRDPTTSNPNVRTEGRQPTSP